MAILKAKLCGLNEDDSRSLKSMLSVANDHLTNEWQIIASDDADLYIYSFDSDEGLTAWNQHNPEKVSALLTIEDEIEESIDILIKKPLRTKNFSNVLTNAEQRIFTSNARQIKKSSSGFFSSTLSGLFGKKNPLPLPTLYLPTPENETTDLTPIVEIRELEQLLENISAKHDNAQAEVLSNNLRTINRTSIPVNKRFALLERYAEPIHHLVTNQHLNRNKIKQASHTDYLKNIHALSLLIEELLIGYQCIINNEILNNNKLKPKTTFLLAMNRIAEFISLSVFYANAYYFSPPKASINKLHQLYLYCEYYQVLDIEVETSESRPSTFNQIYITLMLTCIANSSRLTEHDIIKLPELMHRFANKIEVRAAKENQQDLYHKPEAVGCFTLSMSTDNPPKSLFETSSRSGTVNQLRTFDTHAMLVEIESQFQQKNVPDEIQLLKKIIPQFNASYTRSFERKPCHDNPKVQLLNGIPAIHTYLTNQTHPDSSFCTLRNQSKGGAMINSDILDSYYLEIGSIVGIINADNSHQLAVVRWITTNNHGASHIGLEFLPEPTPVQMIVGSKTSSFVGLLLPIHSGDKSSNTIIVDNDTYLPLQTISVTENNNNYKIDIGSSLDTSYNCEQFSYKIKS